MLLNFFGKLSTRKQKAQQKLVITTKPVHKMVHK